MDQVKNYIDQLIKERKVFVVSKTYCPYCTKAKNVLEKYNIPADQYEVLELDKMADQTQAGLIQQYMKTLTGYSTVPRVFIGGKFIGGGDDTVRLDQTGKLKDILGF